MLFKLILVWFAGVIYWICNHRVSRKHAHSPAPTPQQLRLFCAIPLIGSPATVDIVHTITTTWGNRCDGLKFFVRRGERGYFADHIQRFVVELDLIRNNTGLGSDGKPAKHILEKVQHMHRYVYKHYLNDYEIFSKIDSDALVLVKNLKKFVKNKKWDMVNDAHYFGHVLRHVDPALVSGPASFFSREAYRRLGKRLQNIPVEIGDRRNFKHGRCVVSMRVHIFCRAKIDYVFGFAGPRRKHRRAHYQHLFKGCTN